MTMTMTTTTQQWFPIPNYSLYEANREGEVRWKPRKDAHPSQHGLLELDEHGLYTLQHDWRRMWQVADKPWILFLAFGIEDLSLLERCKNYRFKDRWHLYRGLRDTDMVIDKLLSDDYSPQWNEYFAEVIEYENNLNDERRFHASIDIYEEYADSWHRPLQAARACLNLGLATVEKVKTHSDLQELLELAIEWNDDSGEGQYDVKDLTYEQAWDYMISYCSKPYKDPSEMFWGLFCIEETGLSGYPDTFNYVKTQPFEVLEQWIAKLKMCDELDDYLESCWFEDLSSFAHFTPEWNDRFRALIPDKSWEPWSDPFTWTPIPGFSRYEMTDDEYAKPWNLQVRKEQGIPRIPPQRTFDYDQADTDGNPLEIYTLKADDGTSVQITYPELLERTYPNES